jgi:hypothetical protein
VYANEIFIPEGDPVLDSNWVKLDSSLSFLRVLVRVLVRVLLVLLVVLLLVFLVLLVLLVLLFVLLLVLLFVLLVLIFLITLLASLSLLPSVPSSCTLLTKKGNHGMHVRPFRASTMNRKKFNFFCVIVNEHVGAVKPEIEYILAVTSLAGEWRGDGGGRREEGTGGNKARATEMEGLWEARE